MSSSTLTSPSRFPSALLQRLMRALPSEMFTPLSSSPIFTCRSALQSPVQKFSTRSMSNARPRLCMWPKSWNTAASVAAPPRKLRGRHRRWMVFVVYGSTIRSCELMAKIPSRMALNSSGLWK
jgi:hypothetical protein